MLKSLKWKSTTAERAERSKNPINNKIVNRADVERDFVLKVMPIKGRNC